LEIYLSTSNGNVYNIFIIDLIDLFYIGIGYPNGKFVIGDRFLVFNHSIIFYLSYVCPSSIITGSSNLCKLTGQVNVSFILSTNFCIRDYYSLILKE